LILILFVNCDHVFLTKVPVVTLPHNHLVCVQTKSFLCIFLFVISSVLSSDELAFVSSFFLFTL
jgi:hypothetical protein